MQELLIQAIDRIPLSVDAHVQHLLCELLSVPVHLGPTVEERHLALVNKAQELGHALTIAIDLVSLRQEEGVEALHGASGAADEMGRGIARLLRVDALVHGEGGPLKGLGELVRLKVGEEAGVAVLLEVVLRRRHAVAINLSRQQLPELADLADEAAGLLQDVRVAAKQRPPGNLDAEIPAAGLLEDLPVHLRRPLLPFRVHARGRPCAWAG
mmetsp:Transcript_48671/g.141931  ORF Transcript_48671/g.141931 Transcript_48671/m.141931 type:complete len:212 (+) Transcript_48671:1232-1867(+)